MVAVAEKIRVSTEAKLLQASLISLKPMSTIAMNIPRMPGNESNPFMPMLNQVIQGLQDAALIIGHDGRFPLAFTNEEDGMTGINQTMNIF